MTKQPFQVGQIVTPADANHPMHGVPCQVMCVVQRENVRDGGTYWSVGVQRYSNWDEYGRGISMSSEGFIAHPDYIGQRQPL